MCHRKILHQDADEELSNGGTKIVSEVAGLLDELGENHSRS